MRRGQGGRPNGVCLKSELVMADGKEHNGLEASKSTPTLVWGNMGKKKTHLVWCLPWRRGLQCRLRTKKGFGAVEDMGTFAAQSHRVADDTRKG